MQARTGIIGGSGLYDIQGIEKIDSLDIDTPYGKPSDKLLLARINGHEVVFLPRHGRTHSIPPHKINYRANIYAMKVAGVNRIISVSAVGSLRQEIEPGHFVLVDQFVDRTHSRESTFFDGPIVAHVSMADPVCACLKSKLLAACTSASITTHPTGNYMVMQGPQFSSRAESELYRSWGMDVIGMTNMPEAKLAREAEICYATVAMSTDYDCWHEEEENVSVSSIVETMHGNVTKAQLMLQHYFNTLTEGFSCSSGCPSALEHGIFADLKAQSDEALRPVHVLVERLL
ncbi:5'-methylthioadenosine phosphorylase [Mariprofundus ferrinatatus]|uniref:S-methyl-5'-thioadenosine phosphorylase n=1 Tax=Mariprofundus ferrinatatus TaxID=1921087 RepID=A0A2K8L3H3_9PROT|nr:S-methyl-5'-thioadenosine phosphorylase [Mariprofundus ferrinatatus]ATX81803.1 5'-methylthioadenosine phosphorylase [Mariprofundus ferrinatatus]